MVESQEHNPSRTSSGLVRKYGRYSTKRYSDEELLALCEREYPGVTRGQLQEKNNALYMKLWKRGLNTRLPSMELLRELLREEKRRKNAFLDQKFIALRRKMYPGFTSRQLKAVDPLFHSGLVRRKIIDQAFPPKKK